MVLKTGMTETVKLYLQFIYSKLIKTFIYIDEYLLINKMLILNNTLSNVRYW